MPRYFFRFLIQYKYAIIFPIAVVEGPVITMFSGFLVSLGYLSLVPTYFLLLFGDLISDSFFYLLGRFGRDFLSRRKFFRESERRLERVEEHYKKHPRKTIIVAKASYGVGSFFLAAAGAGKMGYGTFLEYILVPNAVRTLALLLIGFYFGSAWQRFGIYLRDYALAVAIILVVGGYVWLKLRRGKVEALERAIVRSDVKPFE